MWKYVSRRVKDSIELGINVRKSFTVQQQQILSNARDSHKQQQQNAKAQNHLDNFLLPQYQDPSREKFKRKYHRLNNKNKCFLNALTWSTAIVTGFYASQLLCLYRRKQRYAIEGSRCLYSKYLVTTTETIHRNVQNLLAGEGQISFLPSLPKLECPFKRAKLHRETGPVKSKKVFDDVQIIDPGYKQHETFYGNFEHRSSTKNVHKVSNEHELTTKAHSDISANEGKEQTPSADKQDAAIDDAIRKLFHIVGELEFQMGLESVMSGDYLGAVDHFKLSCSHNHPGGIFNLALCYEQGVGVKKNLRTAKSLYESASELGHAKAFYNLGVFHAQGLGGARKNFKQAKKYFEMAAELGSHDAIGALSILLPPTKKLPIVEELPENDYFLKEKQIMSETIGAIAKHNLMRVAIS